MRIKDVLKTLYNTTSDDKLEALQQVIKRANKKLATTSMLQRFEVRRRSEFLQLYEDGPTNADDTPTKIGTISNHH